MRPPRYARRFLEWFCPPELHEGIEGDLLEKFDSDAKEAGENIAKRRFIWNVMKFFRPEIILRNKLSIPMQQIFSTVDLAKSYVLIAWRNMLKYRSISLINIIGLSISMAVGLLILMTIKHRLDYDTFHPAKDRLYRVTTMVTERTGDHNHYALSPQPVGQFLKDNYSVIEEYVTIIPKLNGIVIKNKEEISIRGAFASGAFFEMFGFSLRSGNPDLALTEPNSLILSEETAFKFFGRKNPLGETLTIEGFGDFTVTGIMGKPGKPSQINFEVYASMASIPLLIKSGKLKFNQDWNNLPAYNYVRVKQGSGYSELMHVLSKIDTHIRKTAAFHKFEASYSLRSHRIDHIPFSGLYFESGRGRSIQELMMLSIFGLIMILLAVFNYTNMTVARIFSRSKEIGIRKVNGAPRSQLLFQMMIESVLLALVAVFFASLLARSIPLNSSFANDLPPAMDVSLLVWIILFAIATGCSAGFFPALILSRVKPVLALKNIVVNSSSKKISWRKGFIVFQFSVSMLLLIILMVSRDQMQFQVESDYGFRRENIIHVNLKHVDHNALSNAINQHAGVERIAASSYQVFYGGDLCKVRMESDSFFLEYLAVDPNFIPTYDLALIAGNNFSPDISSSREQYILLNEKAVERLKLGTPQEAIGKAVVIQDTLTLFVAGVFKDYHAHPFKRAIAPLAFRYKPDEFRVLNIRTAPASMDAVLSQINTVWHKIEPDFPLDYSIFEQEFNAQQSHPQDTKMIASITLIAIIISCLGLLGTVMYNTQARTKEIGIRKVMGAHVFQVLALISWSFLKLLLIASFIAIPIGYFLGDMLLSQFVYKTEFGPGILLTCFLMMITVGLLTIGPQTIKASLKNPVDTLRYE